jgi:hypothetical protein
MKDTPALQPAQRRGNTSGYPGVYWHRQGRRWSAQLQDRGRRFHLGLFDTPEAAYAVYVEAKARVEPSAKKPRSRNTFPSSKRQLPIGVYRRAKGRLYRAIIVVRRKQRWLGNYATAEEAHRAYLKARYEELGP